MDATFPIEVHIGLINSLSIAWSAFQALNAYIVASNYCYIHTNSLSHLLFPNPLYLSNFLVSLFSSLSALRQVGLSIALVGPQNETFFYHSTVSSFSLTAVNLTCFGILMYISCTLPNMYLLFWVNGFLSLLLIYYEFVRFFLPLEAGLAIQPW